MKNRNIIGKYSCLAFIAIVGLSACRSKTETTPEKEDVKDTAAVVCTATPTYTITESVQDSIALSSPSVHSSVSLIDALSNRHTVRSYSSEPLSDQQISDMLWCVCGVNREDGKLTAPTARNAQEIDVYLYTTKAIYYYQKSGHSLKLVKEGDFRQKAGTQPFYGLAPIAITFVADFNKMADFDEEGRQFYSATDVGYVSQNLYLYCAASGLATVACGSIDRPQILETLGLTNAKPLLSHPVGFEK